MRTVLAISTALLLTFGILALAQGDETADAKPVTMKAFQALTLRVDALQAEADFLRSREEALRAYVLKNEQRAKGLMDVVSRARSSGFEARSIPAESRKILLSGLEAAAKSLRDGLPAVSPEEAKKLKEIAKLRRAAGMD